MVEIAQKHKDQLERIKENVEKFYDFFKENYETWYKFKKFLYITSLSDRDRKVLKDTGKPELEFNILEAYVSRQKGEFAKQEPSILVSPGNNGQVEEGTVETVNGHMRDIEDRMRADNTAYQIYDDMLSGGFSVGKVYTKYADSMSFEQDITVKRVFDPTLCGFDPLAQESHKGDGEYDFEIMPYREKEFNELGYTVDTSKLKFSRNLDKFNWSYKNNKEKIILLCTYFEKKYTKVKLVKLSDQSVMTQEEYDDFLVKWELQGKIEQPPQVIDSRTTRLTHIVRYRFIENEVLEHKNTDYGFLPLIFADNDSVNIRDTLQSELKQYTRPYCYQAKDTQKLKNYAGQTLANEIEMMVQHKFKIPIEGIPEQYKEAYTDYQTPQVMVYHQFYDNDPEKRLDPPQEIARIPMPPEVTAAFQGTDQTTQAILGTYDASLGINKQQLSGIAIVEGATQSNATAMPSIVGYMNFLQQVAIVCLDLIPKYYVTPRSIPVIGKDGKKGYQLINQPGQPSMKFASNALKVKVEAGVNFTIQRTRNLQQVTALMQVSPILQQFFGTTPEGLNFILKNLEMSGTDDLTEAVDKFAQQVQQSQQKQPNPQMMRVQLEGQKLQHQEKQDEKKNQIDLAKVGIQDKEADTGRISALAGIGQRESELEMEKDKIDAENARTLVDKAVKVADTIHRHTKDRAEFTHKTLVKPKENVNGY